MTIHVIQHKMLGLSGVKSYAIEGDGALILVDMGLGKGSARSILEALSNEGHGVEDVAFCVITHAHRDHLEGLSELSKLARFQLAVHEADASAVEGATGKGVDRKLTNGDLLPGGIRVIHVPGHTPGNIALLVGDTLIAGDTVRGSNGRLNPPPSLYSKDPKGALESIRRLRGFNFDAVMVSHGDDVLSGGKEALEDLLKHLGQ
jgi:glyoxylase-like metal-dependent hydrolase (beta-lactamase superfamily II)